MTFKAETTVPYTRVVLLVPELLGSDLDVAALAQTLRSQESSIRLLIYSAVPIPVVFCQFVEQAGVAADWLLGPDASAPETEARRLVHIFAGTPSEQQVDLALALSDIVMKSDHDIRSPILSLASGLEKEIVTLGDQLPLLKPPANLTKGLDPNLFECLRWGPWAAGRIEQGLLEIFGFARDRDDAGRNKSLGKLWKCVRPSGLRPGTFFAPDGWEEMELGKTEKDPTALAGQNIPIRKAFEALDRSALYGSYVHRDLTWVAHFLAAFAVFAAVAGEIGLLDRFLDPHNHFWPSAELLVLVLIAVLVVWARLAELQSRWTICRLAAEQLRVARMCLPLLVVPSALGSKDKQPVRKSKLIRESGGVEMHEQALPDPGFFTKFKKWLGKALGANASDPATALTEVKRAVREQGLPFFQSLPTPIEGARWLLLIITSQMEYHRDNHDKLKRVESRLLLVKTIVFAIAIFAVAAHFHFHVTWLLLLTASAPAAAAALHGAETRLGIVHRAALSEQMEKDLELLHDKLKEIIKAHPSTEVSWPVVRSVAREAAEAMGSENTSWHSLVLRERDFLPA